MLKTNPEVPAAQSEHLIRNAKALKQAIYRSKKSGWEECRLDVKNDPWSLKYRVVVRKLGRVSACLALEPERLENIVDTLFPTHLERAKKFDTEILNNTPIFN